MKACSSCGGDRPRNMTELDHGDILALSELTGCPGWKVYVEIIRAQYQDEVDALVNADGDARVQLQRQMKCRAFKARIQFEEDLEVMVDQLKEEPEDKPIPFGRLQAAAMREGR